MTALVPVRYEDSPKLFITSYGSYVCPLCDREWEGGSGFRKAGARRHIFACWERGIRAEGLQLGEWDEGRAGYALLLSENR